MTSNQSYFWTEEWQEDEREADEDIKAGRTRRFSTAQEAISWLRSADSMDYTTPYTIDKIKDGTIHYNSDDYEVWNMGKPDV